jgi:dipeptidyl aminopeptidase/acylaminoacyl peptidase
MIFCFLSIGLKRLGAQGLRPGGVVVGTGPSRLKVNRSACATFALVALFGCFGLAPGRAQDLDKPVQNIDEDITAFAYAPDGRIAYAVNRPFKTKQYDLEHDDIWIQDANGKRRRIFIGEKFQRGAAPFTYNVNSFRWSPNGHLLLAELFTASVDETGKTVDSTMTLVLDESGKEVHLGSSDNVIKDAADASWLMDNATIVYFSEVLKPRLLFSFHYVNRAGGPPGPVFEGRTFLGFVPVPGSNMAYAVERDRNLAGPPRLQRLELLAQEDHEVATLDGYEAGLSLSPSGSKIAYYIDREVLEVREVANPGRMARVRAGFGVFRWAPDETRILLKRSVEKKSGDLVWIHLPPLTEIVAGSKDAPVVTQPTPLAVLHGLTFREFAISPDGRFLAVVAIGRRNLAVYPLPR